MVEGRNGLPKISRTKLADERLFSLKCPLSVSRAYSVASSTRCPHILGIKTVIFVTSAAAGRTSPDARPDCWRERDHREFDRARPIHWRNSDHDEQGRGRGERSAGRQHQPRRRTRSVTGGLPGPPARPEGSGP